MNFISKRGFEDLTKKDKKSLEGILKRMVIKTTSCYWGKTRHEKINVEHMFIDQDEAALAYRKIEDRKAKRRNEQAYHELKELKNILNKENNYEA